LRAKAVVVAYGKPDELEACLDALDGAAPVTVVDNSSCRAVEAVAERSDAGYIDPGANLGFARGVNVGLRNLESDPPEFVLLLNPDAMLTPRDLEVMVEFLDASEHGRVAVVAPRLSEADGSAQRVLWPFPSPARAWLEAIGLGRIRSRQEFVIGAVMLLRWSAILEVGMFDGRYFLYAEETDWQNRARKLGWTSAVATRAAASHIGASSSNDPLKREMLFHSAHETYIRKWYGSVGWSAYRTAACLGAASRALVLNGERSREASRRARLYLRGPRRSAALAGD
jgi:GT2 family glycosyltransferase